MEQESLPAPSQINGSENTDISMISPMYTQHNVQSTVITYHNVEYRSTMQWPALDQIQECFLRFSSGHTLQRLMVHSDTLVWYVRHESRRQTVTCDWSVIMQHIATIA